MDILIRDDDLSYVTRPQELERLYDGIWEQAPIHFATIPFVYARQKETPKGLRKENYWIGENKELVRFLKQKITEGKAVIWQHGFTHRDFDGHFELERGDERLLYDELHKGKEHLERTFGVTVDTLVPPHDRISKAGVLAARRAGFTRICRGFAPLPREIQWNNPHYLASYARLFLFWLRHGRERRYPWRLDFGGHSEEFFYRVQHITRENEDAIWALAKRSGTLRVTTHYRTLDAKGRRLLKRMIKRR